MSDIRRLDPSLAQRSVSNSSRATSTVQPESRTRSGPTQRQQLRQAAMNLSDSEAVGLSPLPSISPTPEPDFPEIPDTVRRGLNSEDEDAQKEATSFLGTQAQSGNPHALDLLGETLGGRNSFRVRDGAIGAYLEGREHFRPEDYQTLANHGLGGAHYLRERVGNELSGAIREGRPGAEVGVRSAIDPDTSGHSRRALVEIFAKGKADNMSESDYHLLVDNVDALDGGLPAHQLLLAAAKEGRAGVNERLDSLVVAPLDSHRYQLDRVSSALDLRARTDSQYQPPTELLDNLVELKESSRFSNYQATNLMKKTFEVASRPEELSAYAHHLVGDTPHGKARENWETAVHHRLSEGGTEPLDAAHQLLTSNKLDSSGARAAIETYGIDPESLRMNDLQALSDKVEEGYQWGAIPVLGKAGATAEGERLDLIRGTLRKALDSDEQSNRSQAVEQLEHLAPRLEREDALALAENLDHRQTAALRKTLEHQNSETKAEVLDAVRGHLSGEPPNLRAAQVMGDMAERLTPADVARLAEVKKADDHLGSWRAGEAGPAQATIQAALERAEDRQTREAAAAALLRQPGRAGLDDDTVRELGKVVGASENQELRQALLGQLNQPPLTDENLRSLGEAYQTRVTREVQRAQGAVENGRHPTRAERSLDELAKLSAVTAMRNDPGNKYRDRIDEDKLNARLAEVSGRQEVQSVFNRARQDAIYETMPHLRDDRREHGSTRRGVKDPAAAQQDYVLSPDFDARLRLANNDQEKSEMLQRELGLLASQDPKKAEETQRVLQTRLAVEAVQENPLEYLSTLPPEDSERALENLLQAAGAGKKSSAAAKQLSTALRRTDTALLRSPDQAGVLIQTLEGLRGQGLPTETLDASIQGLKKLDESGKLGAGLGALSVASLFMRGVPDSWEDGVRAGGDILDVTSHTGSYARVLGASDDLLKFGKFARFARGAQVLGPVGDIITTPFDAYGSYKDFQSGDIVGGSAKLVGAAAGATGIWFGIAALSPTGGPAAPFIAAGACVVGLGALAVDAIWGRSPTEQALRNLEVWRS